MKSENQSGSTKRTVKGPTEEHHGGGDVIAGIHGQEGRGSAHPRVVQIHCPLAAAAVGTTVPLDLGYQQPGCNKIILWFFSSSSSTAIFVIILEERLTPLEKQIKKPIHRNHALKSPSFKFFVNFFLKMFCKIKGQIKPYRSRNIDTSKVFNTSKQELILL